MFCQKLEHVLSSYLRAGFLADAESGPTGSKTLDDPLRIERDGEGGIVHNEVLEQVSKDLLEVGTSLWSKQCKACLSVSPSPPFLPQFRRPGPVPCPAEPECHYFEI